ncbi:hypothetical protein ACFL2H_10025 [Planctomycetota bacterium]
MANLKLYKYATASNNSISLPLDQYVWYAKPITLNDPFDCALIENRLMYDKAIGNRGVLSLSATHKNPIM